MGRLIFLVEERSMQAFLEVLLPRLFPKLAFICIPHDGKTDLDRSIVATLRGWREPGARFVVVRDNDNNDCYELKNRLRGLCRQGGRPETLIRIVCQELEAWYLGGPDAMADAFGNECLRRIGKRARFRAPDERPKPSIDIRSLIPEYQKISGARRMAGCMTRGNNHSHSFEVFLDGIEKLCAQDDCAPAG